MTTPTILVIDDSATIRKMVDSHLSQEGYRVVLAPTAEAGLKLAREIQPDLILLDHQLPGTLGIEVCKQIIEFPECRHTPFVVSSTLRKQAYVEYMDVANVVDSLPKPFKPELLRTTVANALEVGAMIISSQQSGTAVPETVGDSVQPAFSGEFRCLNLRELLDFLNNGQKAGMLEVETERHRILYFLSEGRIQGVVSSSFNPQDIAAQLPASMKDLAPLLKFTMSTGGSSQVDGLVDLLDKKVLDARMLRSLVRQQAAVLTRFCFQTRLNGFSFIPEREPPALIRRSPADTCLAALLVESSLHAESSEIPAEEQQTGWVRHALRGQNLDRTGLSATHVQLLSLLDAAPVTTQDLAAKSGLPVDEVRRVFDGFRLAEWVHPQPVVESRCVLVYEPETTGANMIRALLTDPDSGWSGSVLRDEFVLQLMIKRKQPDVLLVSVDGESELNLPQSLQPAKVLSGVRTVVLIAPQQNPERPVAAELKSCHLIRRPYSRSDILRLINEAATGAQEKPEADSSQSQPSVAGQSKQRQAAPRRQSSEKSPVV